MVKKKVVARKAVAVKKKKAVRAKPAPKKKANVASKKGGAAKRPVRIQADTVNLPARAPVRRVMQADRSIVLVTEKPATETAVAPLTTREPELTTVFNTAVRIESAPTVKQTVVKEAAVLPKAAWSNLPKSFPVQSRFYLAMAEKECRGAASWPFPFARFISSLPDELCGRGLAMQFMALEHANDYIATELKMSEEEVEATLHRDRGELLDRCSHHCPEAYRRMRSQLGGVGVSIETLLEKYLVSRVDRNFQLAIGALVLKALQS